MTAELYALAKNALKEIEETKKGFVFASRKGIVAAVNYYGDGEVIAFRREDGKVHMEKWDNATSKDYGDIPLPADLEERAATMLDNL